MERAQELKMQKMDQERAVKFPSSLLFKYPCIFKLNR